MKRNIKFTITAIFFAVICTSFVGCTNSEKPEEFTESDIESRIESIFGGEENTGTTSLSPTQSNETDFKKATFAPIDDIKNAAMGSGLIQYNNDIFQRGGYITVADFVEKYNDNYDIVYYCPINHILQEAGSYDECKDYLIEYCGDCIFKKYARWDTRWKRRQAVNSMGSIYEGCTYYLKLIPRNNSNAHPVIAYVVNAVSSDEKITLDKAVVVEVESYYSDYKFTTAEWCPLGLNDYDFKKNYDSENENYTIKSLCETLETKGLTENSGDAAPIEEYFNTYFIKDNWVGCYVLGTENLFGAKPLYRYSFSIDSNTDKVSYAGCTLEYFVK